MKSCVFVAFALLAPPALASDWAAQAEHDTGTPNGRQYEMIAAKFHASISGQVMNTCIKSSLPPTFNLYLKIAAGGMVVASSVSPASPVANCFATQYSKFTWPKPPFAPFVFAVEMFGNEPEFEP